MEETNETTRPAFLTVLWILTWVGSGIGLIIGLFAIIGLFTSGPEAYTARQIIISLTSEETLESMKIVMYAGPVCTVLCIIGSVMMWQLKKAGFFIYLIGEVAPLVLSFILLGSLANSTGLVTVAEEVIGVIFPLAFVIMYGLNLKHMK